MQEVESLLEGLCQLTQMPYPGLQKPQIAFVLNQDYPVTIRVKEARLVVQGELLDVSPRRSERESLALIALQANLALGVRQAPWLTYDAEAQRLHLTLTLLWSALTPSELKQSIEQLVMVQIQLREQLQDQGKKAEAQHEQKSIEASKPDRPQGFFLPV